MLQRDLISFNPENININYTIEKIIRVSNHNALRKNISISNQTEKEILVYADANMLQLIIQNLIINAIKFTPEGGEISISAKIINKFVEVSICDTGIGIDPEISSTLFDFTTIYTTHGTSGERGTGLGLPLCKEFVERNGGKIRIESEPGNGSKFIFTLQNAVK
jgi:signal transduction histidine kinase